MSLAKEMLLKTTDRNVEKLEIRDGLSTRSHEPIRNSYTSQKYDEYLLNELAEMNEPGVIVAAKTMDIKETKDQEVDVAPPALPERSALRTSKLLDSLKLNSIESARQSLTTSHDVYLSSEEDASSIADDISDYDFESSSESNSDESEQSSVRRKSREDTARAVSVIFIGKPCIVNLSGSRASSSDLSESSSRRSTVERRSVSLGSKPSEDPDHAPRNESTSPVGPQNKPAFLNTDPFANRHYSIDTVGEQEDGIVPRTPKTPTAAVLQRFQKSLSLVRKRSRQNLRAGASRDSFGSVFASTANLLSIDTSVATVEPRVLEPQSAAFASPQSPATYTDFMKTRRRSLTSHAIFSNGNATQPASPATSRKSLLAGLSINRRRSLKTKSIILS